MELLAKLSDHTYETTESDWPTALEEIARPKNSIDLTGEVLVTVDIR